MKKLMIGLCGASSILFASSLAMAGADISILFSNTIDMKNADTHFQAYFDEGGSYSNSDGDTGTWTLNGDQLCVQMSSGADAGIERCGAAPVGKAIGDSWELASPEGETITATLVAGR